ncbi:MAG: hypothetical protein ACP5HC_06165 [Caldisericum sp.]
MAVFSVIKLSELEGVNRIDAEYYKPEYLNLILKLKQKKSIPLKNLIEQIVSGSYIDTYFNTGTIYIRVNNIGEYGFDLSDLKFVDANYSKIQNKIRVRKGDLVLGRTGTIGVTHIVDERLDGAVMSQHITKIVVDETLIDKYYLVAFLNSVLARKQMEREALGSMQVELTLNATRNLLVIILEPEIETKIKDLVKQFYTLTRQSEILYSQAETLLLEELGLKELKPRYEKTYTAKLSDALSAHRIDAEYFQPAYEEVIEKLKERNIELKPLGKLILGMQKGIEVGSENYQDEGKLFIRVSNLSINGFVDRDQKYISEELYEQLKETYEPKLGDFLLTKDATPGIAYVVKEQIEGIISSGILKLKINESEINKEYLALCINSLVGKMQVERDGGGSVILHWKPEQLRRLQIPLLPPLTQQNIAELVLRAHEARKKAKELLELAKRAVEIAIEKNEEEALKYLQIEEV